MSIYGGTSMKLFQPFRPRTPVRLYDTAQRADALRERAYDRAVSARFGI
jgi:hypothetical protein